MIGQAYQIACSPPLRDGVEARMDRRLRALGPRNESTWLIGDAAAPVEAVGAPLHMTCKTAMPMGAHAADNIALDVQGSMERPFSFADTGYSVSLGRRDGLLQLARRDGAVKDRFVSGAAAAFLEEQVCKYTTTSLWLEAHWGLRYRWLDGPAHVVESRAEAL